MPVSRTTAAERKALPLASGVLDYFPDALLVVAEVSRVGNEQHHPGQPLHWDKSKSTDEADALMRHLIDRGTLDTDGLRHTAKVAWRALALLQRELDAEAVLDQFASYPNVGRDFPMSFAASGEIERDSAQYRDASAKMAAHTGTPVCPACGVTEPEHDITCVNFGLLPPDVLRG